MGTSGRLGRLGGGWFGRLARGSFLGAGARGAGALGVASRLAVSRLGPDGLGGRESLEAVSLLLEETTRDFGFPS